MKDSVFARMFFVIYITYTYITYILYFFGNTWDSLQLRRIYFEMSQVLCLLISNHDNLFYNEGAKLRFGYDRLFSSVFVNPGTAETVVSYLSSKNAGYTRKEITTKPKITDYYPKLFQNDALFTVPL